MRRARRWAPLQTSRPAAAPTPGSPTSWPVEGPSSPLRRTPVRQLAAEAAALSAALSAALVLVLVLALVLALVLVLVLALMMRRR